MDPHTFLIHGSVPSLSGAILFIPSNRTAFHLPIPSGCHPSAIPRMLELQWIQPFDGKAHKNTVQIPILEEDSVYQSEQTALCLESSAELLCSQTSEKQHNSHLGTDQMQTKNVKYDRSDVSYVEQLSKPLIERKKPVERFQTFLTFDHSDNTHVEHASSEPAKNQLDGWDLIMSGPDQPFLLQDSPSNRELKASPDSKTTQTPTSTQKIVPIGSPSSNSEPFTDLECSTSTDSSLDSNRPFLVDNLFAAGKQDDPALPSDLDSSGLNWSSILGSDSSDDYNYSRAELSEDASEQEQRYNLLSSSLSESSLSESSNTQPDTSLRRSTVTPFTIVPPCLSFWKPGDIPFSLMERQRAYERLLCRNVVVNYTIRLFKIIFPLADIPENGLTFKQLCRKEMNKYERCKLDLYLLGTGEQFESGLESVMILTNFTLSRNKGKMPTCLWKDGDDWYSAAEREPTVEKLKETASRCFAYHSSCSASLLTCIDNLDHLVRLQHHNGPFKLLTNNWKSIEGEPK